MAGDDQPDLSAFGTSTASDSDVAADDPDAVDAAGGGIDPENCGTDTDARPSLADLDRAERVELGVELLAHLEYESVSIAEAVDRIETITTNPALTREILDTAERRGVIDREDGRLRTRRGSTFVRVDEQVVRRQGDYECRRCGAGLGTGHFVRFETGELGPFGPECVRKVLGRS